MSADKPGKVWLVGAGIVGLAHAVEAVRRGLSVLVIERDLGRNLLLRGRYTHKEGDRQRKDRHHVERLEVLDVDIAAIHAGRGGRQRTRHRAA